MSSRSYYDVLEIPPNAGPGMIKEAYRALVRKYNVDHPGNPTANEAKFKEVNEAYEVLGTQDRRYAYDGFERHPSSLLYVQKDLDQANGDLEKLAAIAFSPSDQAIRNQAVAPLLDTKDPSILSRISSGNFSPDLKSSANAKLAELNVVNVRSKIATILVRGKYSDAIKLATNPKETPELRAAALDAALTIFDGRITSNRVSDEMVSEYIIGLVCGDLKRHYGKDEEHTESVVPIESRVAIGLKIINYYKGKKEPRKLLKLAEEKSAYFPRALLGKCTEAAVEIYVEAGNRDELFAMLNSAYKLGSMVEVVADGIVALAQKSPAGQSNDFATTARAAIDVLGDDYSQREIVIKKLLAKTIELGDKSLAEFLNRTYVNPPQSNPLGFGMRGGSLFGSSIYAYEETRQRLPVPVEAAIDRAMAHFRQKDEDDRRRKVEETRAAKQRASEAAAAAEAARIAEVAATCTPDHVEKLLEKSRRGKVDSDKLSHGREAIGICVIRKDITTLEQIATRSSEGYLVYHYQLAREATTALIKFAREDGNVPLLMRLARKAKNSEKEASDAAVEVAVQTNNVPALEEMAFNRSEGYPVYIYGCSDAHAALTKIGKETKNLDLLMRLTRNSNNSRNSDLSASANAAIDLCVETMNLAKLEEMATAREDGFAKYIFAEKRAAQELKRLKAETGAVASKMGAGLGTEGAVGSRKATR